MDPLDLAPTLTQESMVARGTYSTCIHKCKKHFQNVKGCRGTVITCQESQKLCKGRVQARQNLNPEPLDFLG